MILPFIFQEKTLFPTMMESRNIFLNFWEEWLGMWSGPVKAINSLPPQTFSAPFSQNHNRIEQQIQKFVFRQSRRDFFENLCLFSDSFAVEFAFCCQSTHFKVRLTQIEASSNQVHLFLPLNNLTQNISKLLLNIFTQNI